MVSILREGRSGLDERQERVAGEDVIDCIEHLHSTHTGGENISVKRR